MIENNLSEVQNQIQAACKKSGRPYEKVKLLAVTKTFSIEKIQAAYAAGQRSFGENYVQEFIEKKNLLTNLAIDWHFIGHLQTNKVKNIANQCALIHSIDRTHLIDELERRSVSTQKILLEVNLAGESTKSGCAPDAVPEMLEHIQTTKNIILNGLMLMPPLENSAEKNRPYFEKMLQLGNDWKKYLSGAHNLRDFSMGTSQDYLVAIECGATIVRLGTTVFGERISHGS